VVFQNLSYAAAEQNGVEKRMSIRSLNHAKKGIIACSYDQGWSGFNLKVIWASCPCTPLLHVQVARQIVTVCLHCWKTCVRVRLQGHHLSQ